MKRTAFTLIEILIVVILLGILAAIVVPQFAESADEANQNACRQNMQTLRTQIELYRFRESGLPADIAAMVTGGYLQAAPTCPTDQSAYTYTAATGAVACPNGH
jgi:general secretion pathway protein G